MAKEIREPNVLSKIVGDIVGKFDQQSLLDQILETMMETFNAEVCSIFLKDENNPNIIRCVAGTGYAANIVNKAKYDIGEGFTGSVAKEGEPVNIRNLAEMEQLKLQGGKWSRKFNKIQFGQELAASDEDFRNLLAVPLKIGNGILGVMKVENKIPPGYTFNNRDILREKFTRNELEQYHFSDEELALCVDIANVISLSIQNSILQKQRETQSDTIRKIASSLMGKFEITGLLQEILKVIMETYSAEACSIFLRLEEEPNTIECVAGEGYAQKIKGLKYTSGQGITGYVYQSGSSIKIDRPEEFKEKYSNIHLGKYDPIQWAQAGKDSQTSRCRNLLAWPLTSSIEDQSLGVIKVENKKSGPFSEIDSETFGAVANIVALAIHNTQLYERNSRQLKTITMMAAHKINNWIADFTGAIRRLERHGSEKKEGNIERLRNTASRLKKLIEEFRKYALPIELNMSVSNINALIKEVIEDTSHQSSEIRFNTQSLISSPPFMVNLDKERLHDVFSELLRNSKKAIGEGLQGSITISTSEVTVDNKKGVEIIFEDTGSGIPKNIVDIFEPYKTNDPQGTGLGLATVKEIIEKHGGIINNIPLEQGACFKIFLPLNAE